MASLQEVVELAVVDAFLKEIDSESTHKMCHQATTWLAIQIKKNGLLDYNIHLCSGDYKGLDHSWVLVENVDDGSYTVVDMTLNQFTDCEVPYVAVISTDYIIFDSVNLCDEFENVSKFITSLGA